VELIKRREEKLDLTFAEYEALSTATSKLVSQLNLS
jgi:hypothetical protein